MARPVGSKNKPKSPATSFEPTEIEKSQAEQTKIEIEAKMNNGSDSAEPETRAQFAERQTENGIAKRISLKLKDDNSIDLESLRGSTAKTLREAIKATAARPDGAKALGLSGDAAPELMFTPEFCGTIYSGVGFVESLLAQRFFAIDADIAKSVFVYSDEERKLLGEPTAIVLSKYAPTGAGKYKDELQLASLLLGITAAKFAVAKQSMAARENQNRRNAEALNQSATEATKPEQLQ